LKRSTRTLSSTPPGVPAAYGIAGGSAAFHWSRGIVVLTAAKS
jgi:hypothetical protein